LPVKEGLADIFDPQVTQPEHEGWGRPVRFDWFSSFGIFAALRRSYAFFLKLLRIAELFSYNPENFSWAAQILFSALGFSSSSYRRRRIRASGIPRDAVALPTELQVKASRYGFWRPRS
jgi:hypothetical protein